MLTLQFQSITDKSALDAVQESKNRVASMALIHKKLYQGENLAAIEMRDYFETIGKAIKDSFGKKAENISLVADMPEIELDVDTADSVAICSGEITPNNDITGFYSVNDDKPFMSFDHMIMTQRGWCSISPELSHANHPHLEISRLQVGDVIWKTNAVRGKQIEYEKIVVDKINIHDCKTSGYHTAYTLHQRGDKTNHPNGYCCHSGYPDVTMHYIAANAASKMEISEQIKFQKELKKLAPQFEKVLGKGAFSLVMTSLKNANKATDKVDHTDENGRLKNGFRGAKHIVLPKLKLSHLQGDECLLNEIAEFGIVNGHCFIDGSLVETEIDGSNISWSRTIGGVKEEGSIRMFHHGLLGKGHLIRDGVSVSFLANGLINYNMNIGLQHQPWLQLEMGFVPDEKGNLHATGFVEDASDESRSKDLKDNSTIIFSQAERKDGAEVLHATLSFNPTFCAFGGSEYIEAEFNFTLNYREFSGKVIKYDDSKNDYRGEEIDLFGSVKSSKSLEMFKNQLAQKMKGLPLQRSLLNQSNTAERKIPQRNSAFAAMNKVLSVEELFTLPMPDLRDVYEASFAKLKDLMLLALDRKDKKENTKVLSFFGEKAPNVGDQGQDLTRRMAALVDEEKMSKFLTDKFAVGYLTQSFSKSDDDKIKPKFDAVKNVDEKLSYFWKGNGNQSFVKDPSYSAATAKLNNYVYAQSVNGLSDYVVEGEKWAKELYDYCNVTATLTGLAMQNDLDGRKRLTHLCSMLQALDSKGKVKKGKKIISYSTALYEKVVEKRLSDFISKSTLSGEEAFNEYLTLYFKKYIDSINDPNSSWSAEVRARAKKDLQELMELTESQTTAELISNMKGIISNSARFITSLRHGPMAVKIQNWAKDYTSRSTGKARAIKIGRIFGNILTVAVYGFGAFQVIQAFFSWDKLSKPQKVSLVTTTVSLAASIFREISAFRAASLLSNQESKVSEIIQAASEINLELNEVDILTHTDNVLMEIEEGLIASDNPSLVQAGEALAKEVNEVGDIAKSASKWERIAAVGNVAAKVFGIIALGASAVAVGFTIADDFASGQPASIKALDILSGISTAVSFIVEVGSGIAALVGAEVLAVVPVIGAVAAVVGILISFILLFIHRKPPPSPVEIYVKDVCIPFIKNLPMPGKKWLEDQAKVANHLSGGKTSNVLQVV